MDNQRMIDINVSQGIGAYVDYVNELRLSELMATLDRILTEETSELKIAEIRKSKALWNIEVARTEIKNILTSNRGGKDGIHGFIAEYADSQIRNSRRAFNGAKRIARVLNNNGPVDLRLGRQNIQMKFYNDIISGLKQASKYPKTKMMYPKDQYEIFEKIMQGKKQVSFRGDVLSAKKTEQIKKLIDEESSRRGEPYHIWLKSSIFTGDDVKAGKIADTLLREEQDVLTKTKVRRKEIEDAKEIERRYAREKSGPSLAEAGKIASTSAVIKGGTNLAFYIYKEHKNGKEVWEFTHEDWKKAGIVFSTGTIQGGVSAASIYALTNVFGLAAPSATAVTSGIFGLIDAVVKYRSGKIDDDGFIDLVIFNSIDATGAALGAVVGSKIIPVPVLGPVVGSIATTTAIRMGKSILNERELRLLKLHQSKVNRYIKNIDEKYTDFHQELINSYKSLGSLQKFAFDLKLNLQLQLMHSVTLAEETGVSGVEILYDRDAIDKYFLQ